MKSCRYIPRKPFIRWLRREYASSASLRTGEVRIVEVGPRDGLQNESKVLELETKLDLINRLSTTGIRNIEAGSFVSPKWVPQMADSEAVLRNLLQTPPRASAPIAYNYLVPNVKGLEKLLEVYKVDNAAGQRCRESSSTQANFADPSRAGTGTAPITSTEDPNEMPSVPEGSDHSKTTSDLLGDQETNHTTEISIMLGATDSFSRANIHCTMAESLDRARNIVPLAKEHALRVRAYISVALGCPYEGPDVSPSRVAELARSLLELGVDEVSVADTTGMGTAVKTQKLLKALFDAGISPHDLALHFHDTYGQALVNVVVGLENGIRVFDAAAGGLGGCPFSKGATGNVSTEDLVHCLESLGMSTGIDIEALSRTGDWISQELGRPNESRAGKAVLARLAPKS